MIGLALNAGLLEGVGNVVGHVRPRKEKGRTSATAKKLAYSRKRPVMPPKLPGANVPAPAGPCSCSQTSRAQMNFQITVAIGDRFFKKKDYRRAIAFYNGALQMAPKHTCVLRKRALAHFHLKRYRRAIKDHSRIIAIDSSNAQAYYERGTLHCLIGEYKKSAADLEKARSLDPSFKKRGYFTSGVAHMQLRHFARAHRHLKREVASGSSQKLSKKLLTHLHAIPEITFDVESLGRASKKSAFNLRSSFGLRWYLTPLHKNLSLGAGAAVGFNAGGGDAVDVVAGPSLVYEFASVKLRLGALAGYSVAGAGDRDKAANAGDGIMRYQFGLDFRMAPWLWGTVMLSAQHGLKDPGQAWVGGGVGFTANFWGL